MVCRFYDSSAEGHEGKCGQPLLAIWANDKTIFFERIMIKQLATGKYLMFTKM